MKCMKPASSWVLLLAVTFSFDTDATSLSCKNRVIHVGDPAEYVRIHCGAPLSIERETRVFANGATLGERCFYGSVNIERWGYKRGGGKEVIVTIVKNKVELIRPKSNAFDRGWQSPCP